MTEDLLDLSFIASGKVGNEWVYQKNGVRRTWVIPSNPQTEEQQAWRYLFGDVQKELVTMGEDLRSQLYQVLGYRWHALALGYLLKNGAAWWNEFASVFEGFDSADQQAWVEYDDLVGLVNTPGMVFFIAASVIYRIVFWKTSEEPYPEPAAGNVAEIAAVWPRSVSMWLPVGVYTTINPVTISGSAPYAVTIGENMTLVQWAQMFYVVGPNNGSNFWTLKWLRITDLAQVGAMATGSSSSDASHLSIQTSFDIAGLQPSDIGMYLECTKTGSPGAMYLFGPLLKVTQLS
jgi:hypothetical protein